MTTNNSTTDRTADGADLADLIARTWDPDAELIELTQTELAAATDDALDVDVEAPAADPPTPEAEPLTPSGTRERRLRNLEARRQRAADESTREFYKPDLTTTTDPLEALDAVMNAHRDGETDPYFGTAETGKRSHYRNRGNLALPPEFFAETDLLDYLMSYCEGAGLAPEPLLLEILWRVLIMTPPDVTLPPLIGGGSGSLNPMVLINAPSGRGKTSIHKAAKEAAPKPDGIRLDRRPSTGQGLAEALLATKADASGERPLIDPPIVGFQSPEIRTLRSLMEDNKTGPQLDADLCSIGVGETIGSANATADRSRYVPGGQYRAGLLACGQAHNIAWLFDEDRIESGTAGRFIHATAVGSAGSNKRPDSPDYNTAPPKPIFRAWRTAGAAELAFPERAWTEVRCWHAVHQEGLIATLDGYWTLNRMKLAAGLALLHDVNAIEVSEQFWVLAGRLMDYSNSVRDELLIEVEKARKRNDENSGSRKAAERIAIDDAVAAHHANKLAAASATIARAVWRAGAMSRSDAFKSLGSAERRRQWPSGSARDELFEHAFEEGWLEEDGKGRVKPGQIEPPEVGADY